MKSYFLGGLEDIIRIAFRYRAQYDHLWLLNSESITTTYIPYYRNSTKGDNFHIVR